MILERIIKTKKREVSRLKEIRPLAEIRRMAEDLPPARDFRKALAGKDCAIIAEIKQRSPSKGRFRADFDPLRIAAIYEANGAAALSVLTDSDYFGGDGDDLAGVRMVTGLPLLRKDFIIDPYQVYETRVLRGDALLLIAGLFREKELKEFLDLAGSLGLGALVEVHTREEAMRAVSAGAEVIGINNRNLETFKTDCNTSLEIAPLLPAGRIVVSESGIEGRGDIDRLLKAGIHAFLVGEALMKAGDMGAKLRELLGGK